MESSFPYEILFKRQKREAQNSQGLLKPIEANSSKIPQDPLKFEIIGVKADNTSTATKKNICDTKKASQIIICNENFIVNN